MDYLQQLIVNATGIFALAGFGIGIHQTLIRKNPFGLTYVFRPLGAFVYADLTVFGLFWLGASTLSLLLSDWALFLLIASLFWLVRSIGETIYWLNQQFSPINRNPVKNFRYLKKVYHNDSVWFIYQIFWQCMTVIFIVTSLYFGKLWILQVL